jgi:hypothetical protein
MFFSKEKGDGTHAGVSLSSLLLGGLEGCNFVKEALL